MNLEKTTPAERIRKLTHPAMIGPFAIWAALGMLWEMAVGFNKLIGLTAALMMTAALLIAAYSDLHEQNLPVTTYFMLFLAGFPMSAYLWSMWFMVGAGLAAVLITVGIFVAFWIIGAITKRMGGGDIWYCTTLGITLPILALFIILAGVIIGAVASVFVAGYKNKHNPGCHLLKTDKQYWTTIPNEKGIQVPYDIPLAVPLAMTAIVVVFWQVLTMV